MNRRQFLRTCAYGALASAAGTGLSLVGRAEADAKAIKLAVTSRTIEVKGKAARVFGISGADGKQGLSLEQESGFNVLLSNEAAEPTLLHWHGLTPPWNMDGVPDNPAPALMAGEERAFMFPLRAAGTNWMHAHTLQEQRLLAAPLIIRSAEERKADQQDVVILLHDFSFRSPEELLAGLKGGTSGHAMHMGGGMQMDHGAMDHGAMNHDGMDMGAMNMPGMNMPGMDMGGMDMGGMAMDLNDIEYDAYLANDRTLDDPEIFSVEKGGRVRLRIINGATATAFTIDTGRLNGRLMAVDGQPVTALAATRFPVAMGQRLDIVVDIPAGGGSFPILALREGATERTGVILATRGAPVGKIAPTGEEPAPVVDLSMEARLRAESPLSNREPSQRFDLVLTGNMMRYDWRIDMNGPMKVSRGERIRIAMLNRSMMGHPMHLHGHHFQVVEIDGRRISGAVRDTVHVPPMAQVVIEFDADNPGRWPFHCHHLYHMASGMMSFAHYPSAT